MQLTRADNITQIKKAKETYSDFTDNLDCNPITGNLIKITNDKSIRQSIKNLILTNFGEGLFQPNKGSYVKAALFEPNDIIAQNDLIFHITSTIEQGEPRANLLAVNVNPYDESISVNILFSIINNNEIQSLDLILERIR